MNKKDHTTITMVGQTANSTPYQSPKRGIGLSRTKLSTCMLVIALVLSACSSSTSPIKPILTQPPASAAQNAPKPALPNTLPAASVPQATATPIPALTLTATSVPQQAAATTPLDPCLLISSQEASTLAGASFGTGKEETTPDGFKSCTYGSQTANVFVVDVVQAPDVATANADKAQFVADLQAQLQNLTTEGLNVSELPSFADGAIMAKASINTGMGTFNGSAIGFLKNTIFFGFSDSVVGGAAPTDAMLQSEAKTVLGRLP
jgi:hypothetical protein